MPLTLSFSARQDLYGETVPRFSDIRDLITYPGVRLVMPAEESEDFDGGMLYRREFDRLRSSPPADPTHKGWQATHGRVYVNSVAEPYMKTEPLRFPTGSMIAREMLWKASDTEPHLVSVMVKRERGFNPIVNDWEFAVIDRGFSRLKRGDSVKSCVQCHANARSSDFLFKTYLAGK